MDTMVWWRRFRLACGPVALAIGMLLMVAHQGRAADDAIVFLSAKGVVNPAFATYVTRGIEEAEQTRALALVIELDTPGGLVEVTRELMQRFNASRVPIVVYVAPEGARAGSAGVFLTMAAHVAAMAPTTNIGAAHPVAAGGKDIESALADKITNDAVAMVRAQALRHSRNADWAEESVRKSVSITSQEALERNVIDLIAKDRADLLRQVDGRVARLAGGDVTIRTIGARIATIERTWPEEMLDLVANPNLAMLLMVIGFNAILYELANPSLIFPGVVGAIALLLGLYGMGTLSPNWTGLLFIALAFLLFILEVKIQSNGLLAGGAIVAMVIGGVVLTAASPPWAQVSPITIAFVTAFTAFVFLVIVAAAVRAQRMPAYMGIESMKGQIGVAKTQLAPAGMVFVEGANWEATAIDGPIQPGEAILVRARHGFRLEVQRRVTPTNQPNA